MQDDTDLLKRKTERPKIKEKEKKEEKASKKEKKKEKEKKPEENKNKLPLLGIKENIVTKIQSIKSYKEEKIKEWNQKDKENLNINDLKLFVKEKYDINNESQKLCMEYLIKNDKKEFIEHYSKYQFVLNLDTRKEIQRKIKDDKELLEIPMIKNNIIPDDCIYLRKILINIIKSINEFEFNNNIIDIELKNIFIENHTYFNHISLFDYLIPTKYSENNEYKYNKLIFDVIQYLYPWVPILETKNLNTEDKDLIYEKILLFEDMSIFIDKENLLNDKEFIDRCDFIFNLFSIYFHVDPEYRNYTLLKKIITTCIPFDLNNAKNQLKEMKKRKYFLSRIEIDGSPLKSFDSENLKEDSDIKLKNDVGKQIKVKAKEINWYLGNDLLDYFNSKEFMICFTYETLQNQNYIKIREINKEFTELFKIMMKSKVVKEAFLKDSEASKFEYPFSNDDILAECLESIIYVPLPVIGLYGFTDKYSFKTYIYSNFKTNSIRITLSAYDNIFKTKMHEFKHISRIYYHLFNINISFGTQETNKKNKNLLSDNYDFLKDKMDKIKNSYKTRSISYTESDEKDYGDIFELFFIGSKPSAFLLANSFFFLKEKSWSLSPEQFMKNYLDTINVGEVSIQRYSDNHFINSVLNYFNFKSDKYLNERTPNDCKKEYVEENDTGNYENEVTYKITYSHWNFTK